ncbi:MAG: inorganic diphosphatase [Candidatus Babeliales bacterium]
MQSKNTCPRPFNPWHDISVGDAAPQVIRTVIEIPQGFKAKYELDKETGLLNLDRILNTELTYPAHYGFVPQTYCPDNDPLDMLVICAQPLVPLSTADVRVLGGFNMIDSGEQDDKIIGVVNKDPYLKSIQTIDDLDKKLIETILYFFAHYKNAEKKKVEIGKILNKQEALAVVQESIALYKKTWQ